MSDGSEIVEQGPDKKKKRTGSVQPPLDGELAKWIERLFRDGETPQSIDYYPLFKGRDREQRLRHIDIKADDHVDAERAVELANDIYSDCQLHCDNLPKTALSRNDGSKTYQVAMIDSRRGGLAEPVGTHLMKLFPRNVGIMIPGEEDADGVDAEDDPALTSRKMMVETFREIIGRNERGQAHTGAVIGDVLVLQKEMISDQHRMIRDLLQEQRATNVEFRELMRQVGQRSVEEKAVTIDAENASLDREIKRASMTKENMWTDVMRAGMLEAVKILGALFPGFGQLFLALVSGKPIPPPPQLPANGSTGNNGTSQPQLPAPSPTPGQPSLPSVSEEKKLVDKFIEAAEKHKIDETHTAAEKLFGKDDAKGQPLEPGVFTREQVSILTGVHMGKLDISALDPLVPGSGKPEVISDMQMVQAVAYSTPEMIQDIARFMDLRKAAREKR